MSNFEATHEQPQLQNQLNDLIFRVVQQKLGNIDHAENRDTIKEECKLDRKTILESNLFRNAIIPALKDAETKHTPYTVTAYYKNEDESAPFDGFILKAPKGSGLSDIEINLEEDLDEIYGTYQENPDEIKRDTNFVITAAQVIDILNRKLTVDERKERSIKLYERLKKTGIITDEMVETYTMGENSNPEASIQSDILVYMNHHGSEEGIGEYLHKIQDLLSDIKPKIKSNGYSIDKSLKDFSEYEKIKAIRLEYLGESGGTEPTQKEIEWSLKKIARESQTRDDETQEITEDTTEPE